LGWGFAMGQEAVDAGDSYVVDVLDAVAHQFRGDDRFFGYRDVAGSRRHDYDHSLALFLAVALEHDGPRQGTILGAGQGGGYGGVLFLGGAGCQHVAAVGGEAGEDVRYLAGRFALGKDHLGHALAQGAVVVELGETEVLKGQVTEALDGVVGGETLFSNLLEEMAKGLGVHGYAIVDWRGLLRGMTTPFNHAV